MCRTWRTHWLNWLMANNKKKKKFAFLIWFKNKRDATRCQYQYIRIYSYRRHHFQYTPQWQKKIGVQKQWFMTIGMHDV